MNQFMRSLAIVGLGFPVVIYLAVLAGSLMASFIHWDIQWFYDGAIFKDLFFDRHGVFQPSIVRGAVLIWLLGSLFIAWIIDL